MSYKINTICGYKINTVDYCKICNLVIVTNYYCHKCQYNLNLCMNAYNHFFYTIKKLNNYQMNLIIDIFNDFIIFIKSIKLEIYTNQLLYNNIIKKIIKLDDINNNCKIPKLYASSNTKTFLYHIFK
jgi:hypothetical protein